MILANFADWHARGKDLDAFRRQAGAAVDIVVERKPDAELILGDVFDSSEIGDNYASDGSIHEAVAGPIARMTGAGIPVYIISGDHDQAGAGRKSAIWTLAGIPGVTCIDVYDTFTIGDVRILPLPWSWDNRIDPAEQISMMIDDCDSLDRREGRRLKRVLAGHISVSGLLMNSKKAQEAVDRSARPRHWQVSRDYLDALIESGLVDFIRLGDFHKRHEHFVGAIRQLNHGEEGNPQGFELLDTHSGEKTWFELDEAPKYRTASVDVGQMIPERAENEILKVRLEAECELDPGEIRRLETSGITVERIVERAEREARAHVPDGILGDMDAVIRMYAAQQTPPLTGEELERHIRVYHQLFADEPEEKETKSEAEPVSVSADEEMPF